MPFLLIHEIVAKIVARSDLKLFCDTEALTGSAAVHMLSAKAELGLDASYPLLPLALWGDGAPCNWDRSESLEMFTLSFPGISENSPDRNIRIPLAAINKKFCSSVNTFDDVFSIITWSLQMLALGAHPTKRHDNSDWIKSDSKRTKHQGQPIGCKAVLAEVRGDWKFYKEAFRFPGWRDREISCFKCRACPQTIRQTGPWAVWRTFCTN